MRKIYGWCKDLYLKKSVEKDMHDDLKDIYEFSKNNDYKKRKIWFCGWNESKIILN